jgi:hypothetical protein
MHQSARVPMRHDPPRNKSFFAAFCSRKEESSFSEEKAAKRLYIWRCRRGG